MAFFRWTVTASSLLLIMLSMSQVFAVEPDWQQYNQLLADNVSRGKKNGVELNQLDYQRLRQDARLQTVYQQIADYPLHKLQTNEEKLAFYINAYNILAIKIIIDHWPVSSIRDIGNWLNPVWKKDAGTIGGKNVTLHAVEHEILRKMGDPRIHMAIVCASVSCPDLRQEAYTARQLNAQLDAQSLNFLSNSKKGLLRQGNRVHVSKIFYWFEEDFDSMGGLVAFFRKYKPELPAGMEIETDLNYDWELNSK